MTELFRLQGKNAVVTGGGGRLGSAFAEALVAAGASVVLAGRDRTRLEVTAERIGSDQVDLVAADVAEEDSVVSLFDQVEERHGTPDVLVNAAAIATDSPLGEVTAEDLAEVLAVNVTGMVLCVQRVAPLMRRNGGGKIVNVGSIYGTVAPDQRIYEGTDMVRASPPYVASKSALINLTRDLAVRLAPWNIQLNMISPGGVEAGQPESFKQRYADRTPAGRMAVPSDLAGTLVYLASPASDYVTGQNIHVDGGFAAW